MTLQPWHPIDTMWLKVAIRDFLAEAGGDLLASAANVDRVLSSGIGFSRAGDPCSVAVEDGRLLGFLYWYGLTEPQLRWKTLFANGSYVLPSARNRGVGTIMRSLGLQVAKEAGYERIVYQVRSTNERGLQEHYNLGAWPTLIQLEQLI